MKFFIKTVLIKIVSGFSSFLCMSKFGLFIQSEIISNAMLVNKEIKHNGCTLNFTTPNMVNNFRADSFSTKEPETLEWIDSISEGSVVWDIGANVGLYSCYAAKQKKCTVFAFEPSIFNLELLARNIFNNSLVEKITIVPLPLSDEIRKSSLNMSSTELGGALSTFGQSYGHDGNELVKVFEFSTIGLSMEDAVNRLNIPSPEYIKMDVDGIEHLILSGGSSILAQVKSILVEVNDDYIEQEKSVKNYLTKAGLKLKEKRHSDIFDDDAIFGNSYNQIWSRV